MNKELVLFNSADGSIKVDVIIDYDTVWLTQKQISELFDKSIPL